MRLRSIISEAIFRRLRDQFNGLVKALDEAGLQVDSTSLESSIEDATGLANYQIWIMSRLKSMAQRSIDGETGSALRDMLESLKDGRLKNAIEQFDNKKAGIAKNKIADYMYKDLMDTFGAEVSYVSLLKQFPPERCRIADPLSLPGVELVLENGPLRVFQVSKPKSLAMLGQGTSWCTRKGYKPCRASHYIHYNGAQRIIFYLDDLIAQYDANFKEFRNTKNENKSPALLEPYGLKLMPESAEAAMNYVKLSPDFNREEIEAIIETDPSLHKKFLVRHTNDFLPEFEKDLLDLDENLCHYSLVQDYIKSRYPKGWPEFEKVYLEAFAMSRAPVKFLNNLFPFMIEIKHKLGRTGWPELEDVIGKNPKAFWPAYIGYYISIFEKRILPLEKTLQRGKKADLGLLEEYKKSLKYAGIFYTPEMGEQNPVELLIRQLEGTSNDLGEYSSRFINKIAKSMNPFPKELKDIIDNPQKHEWLLDSLWSKLIDKTPWPNTERYIIKRARDKAARGLDIAESRLAMDYYFGLKHGDWPEYESVLYDLYPQDLVDRYIGHVRNNLGNTSIGRFRED